MSGIWTGSYLDEPDERYDRVEALDETTATVGWYEAWEGPAAAIVATLDASDPALLAAGEADTALGNAGNRTSLAASGDKEAA